MPVLHVRNVPEEMYAELKTRARSEGRSLSAEVIIMLKQALRQPARSQSEVLAALDARRHRFSPQKAGAPSSTELLRQDDLDEPMSGETDQTQFILRDVGDTLHERLHAICRHLPADFEPYGKRVRTAADCSCSCQHFLKLPEPLGFDWGVCINPRSSRSGLLTFEHQGCEFFEVEPAADEEIQVEIS